MESVLKNCVVSCTDDGGIVIRPVDPRGELKITSNIFDSVRVVIGRKPGAKEIIFYPDPEKQGPGVTYLAEDAS